MASFSNGLTLVNSFRHTTDAGINVEAVRTIPASRMAQVTIYSGGEGAVSIDGAACPEGWSNFFITAGAVVSKGGLISGSVPVKIYISEFAAGG